MVCSQTHFICKCRLVVTTRAGISLVEVLVATAIISVLIAIIFPAIQQARESARRVECGSRLRQIGVAVHNYESVFGGIPITARNKGPLQVLDTFLTGGPAASDGTTSEIMRCPSDYKSSHGVNYGINGGTIPDTMSPQVNGVWASDVAPIRFSSVSDGLSNTAMFAEWLRGNRDWHPNFTPPLPPPSRTEPRRLILAVVMPLGSSMSVPSAMAQCVSTDPAVAPVFSTVRGYGSGKFAEDTAYFHELPPNSNSCYLAPPILGWGVNCPSSFHGHGANVLLVDGSVRFVTSQIDRSVWKSLGTRSGNDRSTF